MKYPTPKTDSLDWSVAYKDTKETKENIAKAHYLCAKLEEKWEKAEARIQELEMEVSHWKSNHDNQKTLKSQLMDRPDLKDRAASIQKLQDRISQLELDNESLRQERNNLLIQNGELEHNDYSLSAAIVKYQELLEDLEAQNKILIETGHWIGQDEAYDLKIAAQELLDSIKWKNDWVITSAAINALRKALNDCVKQTLEHK